LAQLGVNEARKDGRRCKLRAMMGQVEGADSSEATGC
jgi:hypothetical protein